MKTVNSNSTPNVVHSSCQKLCVALLLSLLVLLAPFSPAPLLAQEGTVIHTVAPGEYLSSIARKYNVTVASLMAYNGIRDANLIRPGQQIRIPPVVQPVATPMPAPAQPATIPPTPATGGTNAPLPRPNTPATPARIPPPSASPSGYTAAGEPVITVRRGDTLYGIATRFGVSVSSIIQRNNLLSSVIIVSQRLIIPLRASSTTPASHRQTPVTSNSSPVSQPTATPEAATGGPNLLPTAVAIPESASQ
ncbi:MAG: LysM peptidoglycan-binding domain-containing protein [Chloroflexi bacterium]|nr:LysM peptidoglycan-binding domain-containing protein [Chloroflexota bacterium]